MKQLNFFKSNNPALPQVPFSSTSFSETRGLGGPSPLLGLRRELSRTRGWGRFLLTLVLFLSAQGLFAQETTLTLPTTDNTSSFNVTNSNYAIGLKLNADAGFYIGGTYGTGSIPVSGTGARLMWYPAKAAFRAGYVYTTQWNDGNIGLYSTAMGYSTTASGHSSTAIGNNTTASGSGSTAMGYSTTASGYISTAMGNGTTASAGSSTAMGAYTTASGGVSTAMGTYTTASGNGSTAMGAHTTAQAYGSLVIGQFNVVSGTTGSWVTGDPLFVCGNGTTEASPSNALTLYKDGNMTIAGTLTENSDIRLKTEITPLHDVLQSIKTITPISYRFKDAQIHPKDKQIGFSAQEIEKEFPELVSTDEQGYLSVDYGHMTAVLLKAVQEQQEVIAQQNEKIVELEKALLEQNSKQEAQQIQLNTLLERFSALEAKLNITESTAINN